MLAIVIHKLCKWEQAGPVVLLVINEHPQIGLQGLILLLCLPIYLWVECGAQMSLLLNNCADFCLHPTDKNSASVQDYPFQYSKSGNNFFDKAVS
jgi:hypothetical protein